MSNGGPTLGAAVITQALGPFDEIEFLGAGSFGETYRVRKNAGNDYAIKAIHNLSSPAHLWERELESLRRITSPHVVAFLGAGSFRHMTIEVPYLECEYIAGGSIKSRIDAGDLSPTPAATRALLTGLLLATQAAHTQEILHRDIKPANAALRDGDWTKPVLLDFGLAKVFDMSSHTVYPAHPGTVMYMAPEQLRQQPARQRSDLFAVGAVVYEAGTGHHPFYEPSMHTMLDLEGRIQAGPPTDPRSLSGRFDDDVAEVVLRLLAHPAHRRLSVERALQNIGA
jgi:serine/threonine protein kinase